MWHFYGQELAACFKPPKKPEIVLVPGAWHSPSHYQDLFDQFEQNGYKTHSIRLPSVGSADPKSITVSGDVNAVRDLVLIPLLDAGRNVVVIGHSFGGFVAGSVIHGLGPGERQSGGAVVGFVVIAGFPSKDLVNMKQCVGGGKSDGHAPWVDISVR